MEEGEMHGGCGFAALLVVVVVAQYDGGEGEISGTQGPRDSEWASATELPPRRAEEANRVDGPHALGRDSGAYPDSSLC